MVTRMLKGLFVAQGADTLASWVLQRVSVLPGAVLDRVASDMLMDPDLEGELTEDELEELEAQGVSAQLT